MNFGKIRKLGFTLIELLVVVAIVGFLASITLGYLDSSRKKGADTAVKSNLDTVRSVSGLFLLENGNSYLPSSGVTYGIAACPTYNPSGTNMLSANKNIADALAEAISRGNGSSCYNSGSDWAAAIGLKTDPNTSWCVDSEGSAKQINSDASSAINTVTFACN